MENLLPIYTIKPKNYLKTFVCYDIRSIFVNISVREVQISYYDASGGLLKPSEYLHIGGEGFDQVVIQWRSKEVATGGTRPGAQALQGGVLTHFIQPFKNAF